MQNFSFPYEPALWVGIANALIAVLVAFGLPISEDQKTAVIALVTAVCAIIGAILVRTQVTPNAKIPATVTAPVVLPTTPSGGGVAGTGGPTPTATA